MSTAVVIPRVGDLYKAKKYMARIVAIRDHRVFFARLSGPDFSRERGAFYLPIWFLSSQACGWKLVDEDAYRERTQ